MVWNIAVRLLSLFNWIIININLKPEYVNNYWLDFFFGRYSGVFTGYFIFTAGLQLISFIID